MTLSPVTYLESYNEVGSKLDRKQLDTNIRHSVRHIPHGNIYDISHGYLKSEKDMAVREEGIVVSNDQFRDLITDSPEYAKCIEERLLPYVFMEDYIMLCKDPPRAGEVVPLEQFIRH